MNDSTKENSELNEKDIAIIDQINELKSEVCKINKQLEEILKEQRWANGEKRRDKVYPVTIF